MWWLCPCGVFFQCDCIESLTGESTWSTDVVVVVSLCDGILALLGKGKLSLST